jgi:hypothetical protein
MDTSCKRIGLLTICGVLFVLDVPGFAQTNIPPDRQRSYSALNVARVYVATRTQGYDDAQLAHNLTVTSLYRPMIEQMLARSATFRRQCARIASARTLTIEIRAEPVLRRQAIAGWSNIVRRTNGSMHALINVAPVGRAAELIAHELEHVIEQLDGINLRHMSRVPSSGVRECECDDFAAYETTRAILTGVRVAEEMGQAWHTAMR